MMIPYDRCANVRTDEIVNIRPHAITLRTVLCRQCSTIFGIIETACYLVNSHEISTLTQNMRNNVRMVISRRREWSHCTQSNGASS